MPKCETDTLNISVGQRFRNIYYSSRVYEVVSTYSQGVVYRLVGGSPNSSNGRLDYKNLKRHHELVNDEPKEEVD